MGLSLLCLVDTETQSLAHDRVGTDLSYRQLIKASQALGASVILNGSQQLPWRTSGA